MKPLNHLTRAQLKQHLLSWIIIFGYFNFTSPMPGPWPAKLIGGAIDNANYLLVFYSLALYVFPKYWEKRRYFLIALNILVGYCFFVTVDYLDYLKLVPYLGGHTFYEKYPITMLLSDNILFYSIFGSAGVASFFYRYSTHKFKIQAEKEKQILEKELNFLKNQFNSHITFNFLNFCYSKIFRQLPETAESIELFSNMLHYTLQTKANKKVPVTDEITNIETFIKLQKLLGVKVYVEFNVIGNFYNKFILPHILIIFVENAFKYGVYNNPDSPIKILLTLNNDSLSFTVENMVGDIKSTHIQPQILNITSFLNFYYLNNFVLRNERKNNNNFYMYLHLKGLNI